jgi:hypothetical protein
LRWWGLFRIQVQNSLPVESRHTRVGGSILLEHCNKLVVDKFFPRGPWIAEKEQYSTAPFGLSPRSELCWYFRCFSTFSFKNLLFEFLSLSVNARLLERHLMLQSRKLAGDSLVRRSWISGTPDITSLAPFITTCPFQRFKFVVAALRAKNRE